MAKIIENTLGRRSIRLNTNDIINIVREYQNISCGLYTYNEIRKTLDKLEFADKLIFGFGDDYYKLYANQFCPLYGDFSLIEKLTRDGDCNQLITGGGIVHIQSSSTVTPQQAEKLIRLACKVGCEHFAINRVFSKCKSCGKVYNSKVDSCECGGAVCHFTRVVGFFVPVDYWNKVRREWEFPRRRFTEISDVTLNK
jgi:anaerobic ribonucleoside-triphosphate reductase